MKNTRLGLNQSTSASHLRPISCNTAMNNEDGSKLDDPMLLMAAPFSDESSTPPTKSQSEMKKERPVEMHNILLRELLGALRYGDIC